MLMDGGPEGLIITSWTACEYFNRGCHCGKCIAKQKKIDNMALVFEGLESDKGMDKCITAKWAKEEANRVLGEKVKKELEKCEVAIKKAVSENKFETNVYFYAHELTVHVLKENRGFKVNRKYGGQRDGDTTNINWK